MCIVIRNMSRDRLPLEVNDSTGWNWIIFFHYRKVKVRKKGTVGYPYQIPGTGIRTSIDSNVNRTQPEAGESFNSQPEVREVCRGALKTETRAGRLKGGKWGVTDKGVAKNRKNGGAFVDPGGLGTIVSLLWRIVPWGFQDQTVWVETSMCIWFGRGHLYTAVGGLCRLGHVHWGLFYCRVLPADGHGLTQLHIYVMSYNSEIPLLFYIILPWQGHQFVSNDVCHVK